MPLPGPPPPPSPPVFWYWALTFSASSWRETLRRPSSSKVPLTKKGLADVSCPGLAALEPLELQSAASRCQDDAPGAGAGARAPSSRDGAGALENDAAPDASPAGKSGAVRSDAWSPTGVAVGE